MSAAPSGFAEFVSARSPALVRTAYLLTGDRQLAEDLVQSALVRAWPHWDRVAGDHPEAYVRRIMINLQNSWWRRRWRGEVPTEQLPEPHPTAAGPGAGGAGTGDDPSAVADRMVLAAALAALPRGQRQVVVLRYVEDRSVKEVAEIVGCSEGTVKSQAARGLAALRDRLADLDAPADGSPAERSGPSTPRESTWRPGGGR